MCHRLEIEDVTNGMVFGRGNHRVDQCLASPGRRCMFATNLPGLNNPPPAPRSKLVPAKPACTGLVVLVGLAGQTCASLSQGTSGGLLRPATLASQARLWLPIAPPNEHSARENTDPLANAQNTQKHDVLRFRASKTFKILPRDWPQKVTPH